MAKQKHQPFLIISLQVEVDREREREIESEVRIHKAAYEHHKATRGLSRANGCGGQVFVAHLTSRTPAGLRGNMRRAADNAQLCRQFPL